MTNLQGTFFPKWTNSLRSLLAVGAAGGAAFAGGVILFGFSPQATDVGYAPEQPLPYSHALHAGKLGIDCRYCHTSVEDADHANVPPTQTCFGCHASITLPDDRVSRIKPVIDRHTPGHPDAGKPMNWVKIHDLPDYAYFNHSAHVRRGVGCVSCHGRIDKMEVVYQDQPLSMQWCLSCHRNPEPFLRPLDQITNMEWTAPGGDPVAYGKKLREEMKINPSQDCSTCHR